MAALVIVAAGLGATFPPDLEAAGSTPGPPGVLVNLSVAGGIAYTGVLRSAPTSAVSYCSLISFATGKRVVSAMYEVSFHKAVPLKEFRRQFGLTLRDFRWGTRDYTSAIDDLLDVTVFHQSYFGSRSLDPAYRITVHIGRHAMAGTFAAWHVGSMLGIHRQPVSVRGTWRCARLLTRTIQVK